MFLRSEWIHQHKNVLIIFIFYYTTRKACQLGSQSSGHTDEGERAERKKKERGEKKQEEEEEKEEGFKDAGEDSIM